MKRNSTLVCVPIIAESVGEMVTDMGKAKGHGADLVEIRLDYLKTFNHNEDLKRLVKECPLPTLFSYRYFPQEFLTLLSLFYGNHRIVEIQQRIFQPAPT